jgi:hypothetical protein
MSVLPMDINPDNKLGFIPLKTITSLVLISLITPYNYSNLI